MDRQQPYPSRGDGTLTPTLQELTKRLEEENSKRAKEAAEELLRKEHDAEAVAALSRAHARLAASGGMVGMPGSH